MSAPDLKAPPADPDLWVFNLKGKSGLGATRAYRCKTWFEARAKACAFFGCEPGDVVCVGRPV